jgi:hypothetical protein
MYYCVNIEVFAEWTRRDDWKDPMMSNELINQEAVIEGELVGDECELRLRDCTNTNVELVADAYMSDVYGEHKMVMACPECQQSNVDAI